MRNDSGACGATTRTPGTRSPWASALARPPDRGAGNALEFDDARARRRPDAVQQRQDDADRDALLDRQEQQIASSVATISANSPRLRRQTSTHVATRTIRCATNSSTPASAACGTWASRPAPNAESASASPAQIERAELRDAAGFGDDRRARRAGVERKGADQSGQQAGRADPDEIAVDVGPARRIAAKLRVVAAVCTMTIERDDAAPAARVAADRRATPPARQLRRRARHRAERRDAMRLQPERGDQRGGEPQARSARRESAGPRRSPTSMIASTPRPMPSVGKIGRRRARRRARRPVRPATPAARDGRAAPALD